MTRRIQLERACIEITSAMYLLTLLRPNNEADGTESNCVGPREAFRYTYPDRLEQVREMLPIL